SKAKTFAKIVSSLRDKNKAIVENPVIERFLPRRRVNRHTSSARDLGAFSDRATHVFEKTSVQFRGFDRSQRRRQSCLHASRFGRFGHDSERAQSGWNTIKFWVEKSVWRDHRC